MRREAEIARGSLPGAVNDPKRNLKTLFKCCVLLWSGSKSP
jgi:hypothetical protein